MGCKAIIQNTRTNRWAWGLGYFMPNLIFGPHGNGPDYIYMVQFCIGHVARNSATYMCTSHDTRGCLDIDWVVHVCQSNDH